MADINEIIRANTTPRSAFLDTLERYVDGTQYEGRVGWFDACEVPLWEREPCVVSALVGTAVRSFVDLLLGESRFPVVTPEDTFLDEAYKQCRFRRATREILASALGCGTGVAIFGIRSEKFYIDAVKAKWCTPDLTGDGTCTRLEIKYPYVETYRNPETGKWEQRVMIYRRVLDATRDAVFLPVEALETGLDPKFTEDPAQSSDHKLGFCPVRWYPLSKGCAQVSEIDGHAIHQFILDEIQAHDFSLSQRHRAAMFVGDPQLVEIGVEKGYNPSQAGRSAVVAGSPKGGAISMVAGRIVDAYGRPVSGYYAGGGGETVQARKKSPGIAWQYEQKAGETRVEYLQIGPEALKAIDENSHDLRQKIAEALCVVFMDPENVKFAATVSGKALETLKARQLDRCDHLREDFEEGFLIPANRMLYAVAKKAAPKDISHRWGQYFKADAEDESKIVSTVVEALTNGLVPLDKAVEKVAAVFNIEDIDEAVKLLEAAQTKKQEQELTLEHEMAKIANGTASSPGGGKGQKKALGGGKPVSSEKG